MRITITVDSPTGDFQGRLLALLAEHAGSIEVDATWNVWRAEAYYLRLPPKARHIVREAVARGGYVSADDLRTEANTSLRGHSGALTKALNSGASGGEWPEGMPLPIVAQGPGYGKVAGYRMPDELLETFRAAIVNVDGQAPAVE